MDDDHQPLDPLGDLVRAGLEMEVEKNAAIERLSAEVERLSRELSEARPIFSRVHVQGPASARCSCCRKCGAIVPCFDSIERAACASRCFCAAPMGG
jgi:hypothetical protein